MINQHSKDVVILIGTEGQRFIKSLRQYKDRVPKKMLKTLRGQVISGDLEGAKRGLIRCLSRRGDGFDRAR